MTIVYVDVLIGLNLFVNYFLLLATARITRFPLKNGRNLAVSFVLSLTSLIILLPDLPWVLAAGVRLAIAAAAVLMAFGTPGKRAFLKLFGAFFSASFAFAGVMLALWLCFKPSGLLVRNGAVYFNLSPLLLAGSTVVAYGVIVLLRRHFGKAPPVCDQLPLCLQYGEKTISVRAKWDTGMELRDLYSDHPLVLLDPAAAKKLLGDSPAYRLLPYQTVSGSGMLASFVCQQATVEIDSVPVTLSPVTAAISDRPLNAEYQALVGSDFMERMDQVHEMAQTMDRGFADSSAKASDRLHKRLGDPAAAAEQRGRSDPDRTAETRR